jgi:hypothetical protein
MPMLSTPVALLSVPVASGGIAGASAMAGGFSLVKSLDWSIFISEARIYSLSLGTGI